MMCLVRRLPPMAHAFPKLSSSKVLHTLRTSVKVQPTSKSRGGVPAHIIPALTDLLEMDYCELQVQCKKQGLIDKDDPPLPPPPPGARAPATPQGIFLIANLKLWMSIE